MKERHANCLTKRELQQRDYEQGDNATKRHKGQRSRFHMYIKAGFGGNFKGDNKPCLHYLATSQLLLQASASAPPSICVARLSQKLFEDLLRGATAPTDITLRVTL